MIDLLGTGEKLQNARRRAGKTLREVENETGVAYALISKIETGHRPQVAFTTICRLANALDVSLDELAGRTKR